MTEQRPPFPPSDIGGAEHVEMVRGIFSTVSRRYDFINRLLSLRRDVFWRKFTCRKMDFIETGRLIDIATGTADLAIEAALGHDGIRIIGLDFSLPMVALAREKVDRRGLKDSIELIRGDALTLPFDDSSFDVAVMAFGLRNMPHRLDVLQEMGRVVVPEGQVMILEMTLPQRPFLKRATTLYLKRIMPRLAAPFTDNPAAYHYLADSIINFPEPAALADMMIEAGLEDVRCHELTLGFTCLHIGRRPI